MKFVMMVMLLTTLASCLKTAEQVKREQRMENISQQMSDSQNIVADMTVMLKNMQQQIDQLSGKIDELQHQNKALQGADLRGMNESLTLLRQQVQTLTDTQKAQGEEISQQRGFIEKVTDRLGKISSGASSSKDSSKKNTKNDVEAARALIQKKKFSEAKEILQAIVDDASAPASEQNKALHSLGVIEYDQAHYENGLVYFSKIYTKYPKSSLAPNSLLLIGKSLARLGKKTEAKQAFDEVVSNYPTSSSAKEAQKELKKI